MQISASVRNSNSQHDVSLATNGTSHAITIPPGPTGFGSGVNGGELLFLALATCYCNDIYREAAKRGIEVEHVEVHVDGEFGQAGDPATNVTYRASVRANASEDEIRDLIRHTDTVAEIQNTLRQGTPVVLSHIDAVSVDELTG
jgi:uncharacterized OsmC-like protein